MDVESLISPKARTAVPRTRDSGSSRHCSRAWTVSFCEKRPNALAACARTSAAESLRDSTSACSTRSERIEPTIPTINFRILTLGSWSLGRRSGSIGSNTVGGSSLIASRITLAHVLFFVSQLMQPQRLCPLVADPDEGLQGAGPHRPLGVIQRHIAEGVHGVFAADLAQDLADSHAYLQIRKREGLNERLDDAGPGNLQEDEERGPSSRSGLHREALDELADMAVALQRGSGLRARPLIVLVQGLEKEGGPPRHPSSPLRSARLARTS